MDELSDRVDVVVIGGGIAGSAVAGVLARRGLDVVVLERQQEFRDRIRGENMQPWGVAEMRRLGLQDVLVAAGGGFCEQAVLYDELRTPAEAEAAVLPLGMMVDGVPGTFNVGHPQACAALLDHAAEGGARVVRGVGDVDVEPGSDPSASRASPRGSERASSVRYELDGNLHELRTRLVIAADGRQSTVRRQLAVDLRQVESKATLGGLLVHVPSWTHETEVLGTEGDVHFLAFPRPEGFVRLYLALDRDAETGGAGKTDRFLDAFNLECFPDGATLAQGEVAGPCAFYVGSDSWMDEAVVDGVVLVGDAAGWSDPIIGQGLSIALRDARLVADVLAGDDWSPAAFEPYVAERAERMRRLRLAGRVTTEIRCTFSPEGRERRRVVFEQMLTDPLLLSVVLAPLTGPEAAPEDAFTGDNISRILTLA